MNNARPPSFEQAPGRVYSGVDDTLNADADKKKTKKDKVRSAWISFVGRIVAQLVGAIATVALGVMVLHRYTAAETRPPAPAQEHHAGPVASSPQPPVIVILSPGMLAMPEGNERLRPTDRGCIAELDTPPASAADLSARPLLSR